MKVKVGDIVRTEFGTGPIVGMSRDWCIHKCEDGCEYAVMWNDVFIAAEPEIEQDCGLKEIEAGFVDFDTEDEPDDIAIVKNMFKGNAGDGA